MWQRRDAIRVTLAYADIFDYPLTKSELETWLVKYRLIGGLRKDRLFRTSDYLHLPGRRRLIKIRQAREKWSAKKRQLAYRVAKWLQYLPTVKLVGITGGLAVNNAHENDDIDLFLITGKGTLWVSRLLTTLVVELLRLRRRPADVVVADKICLNMFMSEDSLAVFVKERDLFVAHEVLQMVPLWERDQAYLKFLKANRWVEKFLPNAWRERNAKWPMLNAKLKPSHDLFIIYHLAFSILEPLAQAFQLWYMRKRRTNEVINSGVIRFHPRDARVWIKEKLRQRLVKFNIPLDKVFYSR